MIWTSEWSWWYQQQFGRAQSDHLLNVCQTVGMSQVSADHPTPTLTPPPPSKSHLACHFSPWPPEKKITLGSLQGPTENHVKLLHLLQCGRGERTLRTGSYLRECKVGGCEGVNATQREVRKGKLAIHEALGREPFFFWGGGNQINTSHIQITHCWGGSCVHAYMLVHTDPFFNL